MWSERYEALSSYERGEFRRLANYLLSHTYMVRYQYQPSQQMTLPNADYQMATRLFPVLRDYFTVTGWQLEKDDNYGIMSLINIYDHNRLRIDRFTTLFLYTCRLIYEEQREQASSFHMVKTDTQTVVEKMRMLGLLDKGKTTQKERIEAQRTLGHYNIIQKMESVAWSNDGNELLILPSILSIISNQGINDMMLELEEMRINGSDEAGQEQEDSE
ncbi:hypothetical protein HMPREF0322_03847 [Desulfitobacterium hafniense DP7]|uniref:DUF4194 domain-containing protein n=2 Tax=Desulfitobacterium TaxID=36853 RepID=A0A1M7RVU4_9FIRM|nr:MULTISPECIES: DUF4194 domain-containing protein [Desulfitobacterium]EHL05497.1 hypothetical protein HMPREF0322_03847 [Desulfitobacterium hafniense DP7]SHN50385.1 protein of unknown function [Desulfitobacterium chlororespirans DSM 11544]